MYFNLHAIYCFTLYYALQLSCNFIKFTVSYRQVHEYHFWRHNYYFQDLLYSKLQSSEIILFN